MAPLPWPAPALELRHEFSARDLLDSPCLVSGAVVGTSRFNIRRPVEPLPMGRSELLCPPSRPSIPFYQFLPLLSCTPRPQPPTTTQRSPRRGWVTHDVSSSSSPLAACRHAARSFQGPGHPRLWPSLVLGLVDVFSSSSAAIAPTPYSTLAPRLIRLLPRWGADPRVSHFLLLSRWPESEPQTKHSAGPAPTTHPQVSYIPDPATQDTERCARLDYEPGWWQRP